MAKAYGLDQGYLDASHELWLALLSADASKRVGALSWCGCGSEV